MALLRKAKADPVLDRRRAQRVRLDLEARLIMPSGDREGRLFDLSEEGARFLTEDPPGTGCAAILDWGEWEAYCKVAWSKADSCGLVFARPLARRIVTESLAWAQSGGATPAEEVPRIFGEPLGPRPVC